MSVMAKSGFGPCHYHFRDPQGILHGNFWYYHENSEGLFFDGDPTVWEHHTITRHIATGIRTRTLWGLGQMMVSDDACNDHTYNFVETLIFEPDNSDSGYVLFSDLDENNMLSIDLQGECRGDLRLHMAHYT